MCVINAEGKQRSIAVAGPMENGNCITGDNNKLYNYYMIPNNLTDAMIALANSQVKFADAMADAISKRSEADLIRAKNDTLELKIREREAENNSNLIQSIQTTLEKICDKLEK